jgi:hypothetical protein
VASERALIPALAPALDGVCDHSISGDVVFSNKALFRRFIDRVANQGDLGVIHGLMPPDFVENQDLPAGAPQGRDV